MDLNLQLPYLLMGQGFHDWEIVQASGDLGRLVFDALQMDHAQGCAQHDQEAVAEVWEAVCFHVTSWWGTGSCSFAQGAGSERNPGIDL